MTKYTKFEAIFRNETLVFTDRDPKFRNRLDVYNYICAERLGKKYGKLIRINESTICYPRTSHTSGWCTRPGTVWTSTS